MVENKATAINIYFIPKKAIKLNKKCHMLWGESNRLIAYGKDVND
nr:MAG TPA: hypothetical protein [Bacteriophage sp.]